MKTILTIILILSSFACGVEGEDHWYDQLIDELGNQDGMIECDREYPDYIVVQNGDKVSGVVIDEGKGTRLIAMCEDYDSEFATILALAETTEDGFTGKVFEVVCYVDEKWKNCDMFGIEY